MAIEVRKFSVTVPAGTPKAAPQVSSLQFPDRVVDAIEIRVPPGPRGVVGFQLTTAGSQIIPQESGAFFVTDDELIKWALEDQIDTGAWQLTAYNTGTFAHTLEVRFLVSLTRSPAELVGFQPLPNSVLGSG